MTICCACDERKFPPEPDIPAGLVHLPRQAVGFPEYRRALLDSVRSHLPLSDWRAREGDDLGLMMLEWWAYVLDVVAFYDAEIAQSFYLRTVVDTGALRRLVGLIGYHLRPGIAAEALVAAIAEAGPDAPVPALTAFRSEAFGSEPPQVFESDTDALITWRKNRWVIVPPRRTLKEPGDKLLFDVASLRLTPGAYAIFTWGSTTAIARVASVKPLRALDGTTYAEVTTDGPLSIPDGTDLATIVVRTPTATAGFNRIDAAPVTTTTILLDAIYPQIAGGQDVMLTGASGPELHSVAGVVLRMAVKPSGSTLPELPATQIAFGSLSSAWGGDASLLVHFQLVDGGKLTRPAETRLQRTDLNPSVLLAGVVEPLTAPAGGPLLLQDRDKHGVTLPGTVNVTTDGTGALVPGTSTDPFATEMVSPVEVFGNVIHVVRGETVGLEILGSGDAAVEYPAFKLKKKPLTYTASSGATDGRRSTLSVRVNSVLWHEVPSFYGTGESDPVFIVRQDENGDSIVTFRRLPSGVNNVTATYRFGAGAAKPPAGGLTQIVRPVKGLSRIQNPVAAFGGADADKIADIRRNGPLTALTLGRAVSLADFEALARSFGAVNVSAGWAWDPARQRAVVKLWYIADGGDIAQPLKVFLSGQADPNVPIVVTAATPIPTRLLIDAVTDPAYVAADVRAALVAALTDGEQGPLAHRNVPIGGVIFRSALFEAAGAVAGVAEINGMTMNGAAAPAALVADEGKYLDFLPFTNS